MAMLNRVAYRRTFDDALPARQFDNFQFVEMEACTARLSHASAEEKDAAFALAALMEIPEQFKAIRALGLLGEARPMPPEWQGELEIGVGLEIVDAAEFGAAVVVTGPPTPVAAFQASLPPRRLSLRRASV